MARISQGMQTDLFSGSQDQPVGFQYSPGLISPEAERELISRIKGLPLAEFKFQQYLARRRVMYFGWRYDFENSRFAPTDPIPPFLMDLRSRGAAFAGLAPEDLPHALVTEYSPGTEIGWHRDRPVFENVIGVSLGSSCSFRFRRRNGDKWLRYTINAEPRSVYLMRGPARWEWEHSIPAVKDFRYSVTFRSLRDSKI